VLERGRDQHVGLGFEKLFVVDAVDGGGGVAFQQAPGMRGHGLVDCGQVQSIWVVQATADVADRNNLAAHLVQDARGPRADVAVALNCNRRVRCRAAYALQELAGDDGHAATGGCRAALRATHAERLAGHELEHLRAADHAGGVRDPGHDLRVGVHIGCRDVALAAQDGQDHRGEAAGHALDLALGHAGRVDLDAALGAAIGDVNHRALPGHHGRQGLDLVEVDIRMIADATLAGATHRRVLHAIALEDLDRAVIHLDRDGHGQFALGLTQDGVETRIQVQPCRDIVEGAEDGIPKVLLCRFLTDWVLHRYLQLSGAFAERVIEIRKLWALFWSSMIDASSNTCNLAALRIYCDQSD